MIIVGIDSLSPAHFNDYHAENFLSLPERLRGMTWFTDSLPAIPRTFGSLTGILTGEYPRQNNARANLIPLTAVKREHSIAHDFRRAGYETVFALDERLFANIDEQFGFDVVVGPRMGAADLVLSRLADSPLNNLLMHYLPAVRYLLPNSFANRAAHGAYLPADHSNRIAAVLDEAGNKPLFLFSHFCLSHYPYWWGEFPILVNPSEFSAPEALHAASLLRTVQQIDRLFADLARRGLLENSVVVLMSDHGHQLRTDKPIELTSDGYQGADNLRSYGLAPQAYTHVNGHGINLFDPGQIQTILAFSINTPALKHKPGIVETPVSLIDIAPTVLELAGISAPERSFDGRSLAPFVRGDITANELSERPRLIESDIFFKAIADVTKIDGGKLLQESLQHFEVTEGYPLVQLSAASAEKQMKTKFRAVFLGDWQLVFLPEGDDIDDTPDLVEHFPATIVLYNRTSGEWTNDLRSSWASTAPVAEMLTFAERSYGDELLPWAVKISEFSGASSVNPAPQN